MSGEWSAHTLASERFEQMLEGFDAPLNGVIWSSYENQIWGVF